MFPAFLGCLVGFCSLVRPFVRPLSRSFFSYCSSFFFCLCTFVFHLFSLCRCQLLISPASYRFVPFRSHGLPVLLVSTGAVWPRPPYSSTPPGRYTRLYRTPGLCPLPPAAGGPPILGLPPGARLPRSRCWCEARYTLALAGHHSSPWVSPSPADGFAQTRGAHSHSVCSCRRRLPTPFCFMSPLAALASRTVPEAFASALTTCPLLKPSLFSRRVASSAASTPAYLVPSSFSFPFCVPHPTPLLAGCSLLC